MPAQETGEPIAWSFDFAEYERQMAAVFKANAVRTNAQRAAFVTGLTAAQQVACAKAFISAFVTVDPPR